MDEAMMHLPSVLEYSSPYPLYGIAFSNAPTHPHRIALTSYFPGPTNKLQIVDLDAGPSSPYSPQSDFASLAQANLQFPATKVGWQPAERSRGMGDETELLATTGDVLRIWELGTEYDDAGSGYVGSNGFSNGSGAYSLRARSVLTNSKAPASNLPPITSFSWNPIATQSIVTCSFDTTATLWDINTSQALTQLIAHDRAVYDLSWLPQSTDIFVSVGADGSLRAFDLRTLEHSTILYESTGDAPLARIAFSNTEQHMLACFGMDDSKVFILDMRSPGQPVAELIGHQAPLSAIAWGSGGSHPSSSGGWIASCGDDQQLLLWDLTEPLPAPRPKSSASRPGHNGTNSHASPNTYALSPAPSTDAAGGRNSTPSPSRAVDIYPTKAWQGEGEINNLAFSQEGDWVGCVSGQKLSVLRAL